MDSKLQKGNMKYLVQFNVPKGSLPLVPQWIKCPTDLKVPQTPLFRWGKILNSDRNIIFVLQLKNFPPKVAAETTQLCFLTAVGESKKKKERKENARL